MLLFIILQFYTGILLNFGRVSVILTKILLKKTRKKFFFRNLFLPYLHTTSRSPVQGPIAPESAVCLLFQRLKTSSSGRNKGCFQSFFIHLQNGIGLQSDGRLLSVCLVGVVNNILKRVSLHPKVMQVSDNPGIAELQRMPGRGRFKIRNNVQALFQFEEQAAKDLHENGIIVT